MTKARGTAYSLTVLAFLAGFGLPEGARAGMPFADCQHPPFFPGTPLTVVVVPYAMSSPAADPLASSVARELPLLIQSTTLGIIMKYGGVASVGLVNRSDTTPCTSEGVLAQLDPRLGVGQALVLVSGTLFEENGALYVTTYLRFLRKGITEGLAFDVDSQTFETTIPRQTIEFGAHRLTSEQLRAVDDTFRRSSLLYDAPQDSAASRPMYRFDLSEEAFGYTVLETRGEWLRVTSAQGSGWVRMGASVGGSPLSSLLPELDWLDGVCGYLRFRQGQTEPSLRPSGRTLEWAQTAFDRWARTTAKETPTAPRTAAQLLMGIMEYTNPNGGVEHRRAGLEHFSQARALEPWNAAASNFAAFSSLQIDYSTDSTSWKAASHEREVRKAALSSRGDSLSIRNLRNFYSLVTTNRTGRNGSTEDLPDSLVARRVKAVETLQHPPGTAINIKPPKDPPVDLNTASARDLQKRLHLSDKEASRVIFARPFQSLEDPILEKILGKKKLAEVAKRATVSSRVMRMPVRGAVKTGE